MPPTITRHPRCQPQNVAGFAEEPLHRKAKARNILGFTRGGQVIKAVQEKETTCSKCERHRQTFPRHFDPLSTRQLRFLTNSFVLLILHWYSLNFNHYF